MTTGLEKKQLLLEKGASPEEIAAWETATRAKLAGKGASPAEIDTYFGVGPLSMRALDTNFAPPEPEGAGTDARRPTSLLEAYEAGLQVSTSGLASRRRLPDLALGEDENLWYSIAAAMGTLTGDLPVAIPAFIGGAKVGAPIGGVAGAAATKGSPAGTAAGAFAGAITGGGAVSGFVTTTVRESYLEFLRDNEGKNPTAKDFAVGLAAKALTKKVTDAALRDAGIGAAGGFVGGAAGSRVAAPVLRELVVGAGDLAGAVTASTLITGELPSPTEFGAWAAVALGATTVSAGAARVRHDAPASTRRQKEAEARMKDRYAREGKKPEQTVRDADSDPILREGIVNGDRFQQTGKDYVDVDADPVAPFGDAETLRIDQNRVGDDFRSAQTEWSKYARAARGKEGAELPPKESTELVVFEPEGRARPEGDQLRIEDKRGPATEADIDTIMSKVDPGKKGKIVRDIDDYRFEFIDDLQYAASFSRKAHKAATGKELPMEKNPGELMALARGAHARAAQEVGEGLFDPKTGRKFGLSMREIYDLFPTREHKRAARAYLISKRVVEKSAQGFETGFDVEAAQRIVASAERHKFVTDARDRIRDWNENVIEDLRDSGMLSEKSAANIRAQNEDYVPFFASDKDPKNFTPVRGVPVRPTTKKFKGGDVRIVDPFEALVKNRFYTAQIADNNRARRRVADFNNALPPEFRLMDRVTPFPKGAKGAKEAPFAKGIWEDLPLTELDGVDPVKQIADWSDASVAALEKRLNSGEFDPERALIISGDDGKPRIITIDDLAQGSTELQKFLNDNSMEASDLNWMHVAGELEKRRGRGDIVVFEDGRPIVYRARDPRLAKAFEHMTAGEFNLLVKWASVPAHIARAGITVLPTFIVRALTRDAIDATLINTFKTTPFVDMFNGAMSIFMKDTAYRKFIANGGAGTALINMDADILRMSLLDFEENKRVFSPGKLRNAVTSGFRMLYAVGTATDQFQRVGQFKRATKAGLEEQAAALRARKISLDFARAGASMRALNQIVMFLGPTINGIDRNVMAARNPRHLALMGGAFVLLPTLLLWAANSDEPWYQRLSAQQRSANWYFRVGGTKDDPLLAVIPKPHAWVSAFSNIPEILLNDAKRDNPDLAKDMLASLEREYFIDPTNVTATSWLQEIVSNYDGFTDRPLVSDRLERSALPAYRYTPYTSRAARAVAKLIPDWVPPRFRTPVAIDHIVSSLTGTRGPVVLNAVEAALGTAGLIDKTPTSRSQLGDSIFVRTFIRRETGAFGEIDRFFDNAALATQARGTYRELILQGNTTEAQKIVEQYGDLMIRVDGAQQAIGNLFTITRMIEFNKTLSVEEKQQLVDNNLRVASQIAEVYNRELDARRSRIQEKSK